MSFSGDDGAVKSGSTVYDITGFSLTGQPKNMYDDTSCGDSGSQWKASSIQDWTASVKYKPEDFASAIKPGTELTLELYPSGTATGKEMITVSAIAESLAVDVSMGSLVEVQQTFKVNGVPTEGTAA